jgi:hypothetical protein
MTSIICKQIERDRSQMPGPLPAFRSFKGRPWYGGGRGALILGGIGAAAGSYFGRYPATEKESHAASAA